MSLSMQMLSLVFTCLACAGHGRRVQTSHEQGEISARPVDEGLSSHSYRRVDDNGAFNPVAALAMLLTANDPAAAFNPSNLGAHSSAGNPTVVNSHPVSPARWHRVVRMSDESASSSGGAKITVRRPDKTENSEKAPDESASSSGAAKITVRTRAKTEKSEKTPAAVDEGDDDLTEVTIKVKEPGALNATLLPEVTSPMDDLSPEEQKLLEGTQRANCTQILEALKEGANPNMLDNSGRTPLHFVAGLGFAPAAVLLIHFGAQVDVVDELGLTPLHMAAGYMNARTMQVLIIAGADETIEAPQQGTPLQIIIGRRNFQMQQFMNRTGIDKMTKKKDEKIETLNLCLDVIDNVEKTRNGTTWDELAKEVLTFCKYEKASLN